MGTTTIDVGTELHLDQAIATVDVAPAGTYDIVFTQGITEGTDATGTVDFNSSTLAAPPDLNA